MVYSLLLDFHHSFAMTPAFFWASLFAMNPPLLRGGYGGGVIGDDLGGIGFGKRKKKAAAANDNGDR